MRRRDFRCELVHVAPRKQIQCETSAELDMKTLVWTRGELFPLDQLESRLKCPRCGSRRVTVVFEIPNQPKGMRR
jgi:Zn finger protein HypA/HybF involved in hydrogenase expression